MAEHPLSDRDLLAKLVAFDSTSCNSNTPIAEFIGDYLHHPNVTLAKNRHHEEDKINLVVRVGPACRSGEGLILSGHMDVVPALEPQWQSDPFVLEENETDLVGRGACDMKGFVALAVNLAWQMARRQPQPVHPLVLVLTFDEEVGTLGAGYLRRTWDSPFELPSSAVIGEPTSLRVVRMHKGHIKFTVRTAGKSAHSGYPHLGVNAIELMGRVSRVLAALDDELALERYPSSEHYPQSPSCSLNQAMIRGGSAINIIPDECQMDFGIRIMPGVTSQQLVHRVRAAVASLKLGANVKLEDTGESPALDTSVSARIHEALAGMLGQQSCQAVSYASDGGVLACMGVECVLFGPGDIEVAHRANEFVPKDEMIKAREILSELIDQFCYK